MEPSNRTIFLVLSSTLKNTWKDGLIDFQRSSKCQTTMDDSTTFKHEASQPVISQFAHHIPNQTTDITNLSSNKKGHWERAEKIHIWISKAFYTERTRECQKAGLRLDDWQPPPSTKPTRLLFFPQRLRLIPNQKPFSQPKIMINKNKKERVERASKIQCRIQRPSSDHPKTTAKNPVDPNIQIQGQEDVRSRDQDWQNLNWVRTPPDRLDCVLY